MLRIRALKIERFPTPLRERAAEFEFEPHAGSFLPELHRVPGAGRAFASLPEIFAF